MLNLGYLISVARRSLAAFVLLGVASTSNAGQETNGGDGILAQIKTHLADLQSKDAVACFGNHGFDPARIDLIVDTLQIETKSRLELRGREVAAINHPRAVPALLEISEGRWIIFDYEQRRSLLVHELIHLIGVDDSDYRHSSKVNLCIDQRAANRLNDEQVARAFLICDAGVIPALTKGRILQVGLHHDLVRISITGLCLYGLEALEAAGVGLTPTPERQRMFCASMEIETQWDYFIARFAEWLVSREPSYGETKCLSPICARLIPPELQSLPHLRERCQL